MRDDWRTADYASLPDDEAIAIIRRKLGVGEVAARFILALERGEIDGDTVIENEGS